MSLKITRQALRVNAMLVSLRGHGDTDVIDAICILLLPILEVWRGQPITTSLLSRGIRGTYGWNITESVASVFIERLERDGQLERSGNGRSSILISAPSDPPAEDVVGAPVSKAFDEVMDLFEEFDLVSGDLLYSKVSREDLSEKLIRYLISLDAYSEEDLSGQLRRQKRDSDDAEVNELSDQLVDLTSEDIYLCARFIAYLSDEREELVASLADVVGAGLLAELIEDFRKPTALAAQSNTTIFFDAPLALSLVGVSGAAAQTEARAIQRSLTSIGCRVQVLSESCKEAERVLSAYLSTPQSDRHGITQRAFTKKEVELDYIKVVRKDFETALSKFDINVRHIDIEQFPNTHQYFDEGRVSDLVSKFSWQHMDAREHDAHAIAHVMRLRQGRDHADPLRNSYLFASSNSRLVSSSRRYCIQERLVRDTEYGPAIDLRDLATVAWLRTGFTEGEKLPMSHLLAQSERVLRVRKDIIDRARSQVEKHSPEKKEQFELLLQDNRAVTNLSDRAVLRNWDDDADQSQELLDGMMAAAISVATEEHTIEMKKKEARHRKAQQEAKLRQAALEKEKQNVEQDLQARLVELADSKAKYNEGQTKLEQRDKLIFHRAAKRANLIVGFLQGFSGLAVLALAISVLLSLIVPDPPRYVQFGASVFVLLSALLTILSFYGKGFVGLNTLEERIALSIYFSRCASFGISNSDASDYVTPSGGRLKLLSKPPS